MKPDNVNIIQIVVVNNGMINGLGDDSEIYRWIWSERKWAL